MSGDEPVRRAAEALAAEMRKAGVSSVRDYHDLCDANIAVAHHAASVGIGASNYHDLNRVAALADEMLGGQSS